MPPPVRNSTSDKAKPTSFKPSQPSANRGVDAQINQKAALEYWSNVSADNAGVLGGFPQVSRADLQGSANFLAKLKRSSFHYKNHGRLPRVVDCGAGIGRVTLGFLGKVADVVDVVEPVANLTAVITEGEDFADMREKGRIGKVYNVGLESWTPEVQYDMIWNQWCLGQLNDKQVLDYSVRSKRWVKKGGWMVVKEKMSVEPDDEDVFDEVDSSVTRTDNKFRSIFAQAGLKIVSTELTKGMPTEMHPVRVYALQPKVWPEGEDEDMNEDEEE